ncbi:MAG: hypothetical protein WC562_01775 [Dehalococcoidia bacterium]|jgi:hypothetical protein
MPADAYIMIGMAGFFFILFILAFLRAKNEDRKIDDALCQRMDVKGYGSFHIESGALRIGGWICFLIALTLLIMGIVYLAV